MKKSLCFLLAFLMLFSLVGCGEDTPDDTTTDTNETSAVTTTESATTTTAEQPTTTTTAATTTTTVKPTATTTVSYSAFQSSQWLLRVIVNDGGQFCRSYTLVFDDEPRIGEATSSPYEEMVPPEYRDQEKPDFEFSGIQWYTGAGGFTPISSVKENGNTITLTDEDGKQLVLTRTGETTAKVVSNTIAITVKAGDVFTITK